MSVRAAARADLARCAEIHAASFPRAWSEADIATFAWASGAVALITEGGEGFVLVRVVLDEAEILSLAVAPEHRRAGHARALLAAALEEAARRGASRAFLEVEAGNTGALALYAAFGFTQTGRRLNYYAGAADALTMSVALP